MRHQGVEAWEQRLNELLKRVDDALEKTYGRLCAPHPARPAQGATANPQQDGLFRVTASFTPGFGSALGKGYVLHLDIVTLDAVPADVADVIRREAVRLVQDGLEAALPGRGLKVARDGNVWKIVGDLRLPNVED
ncbi:MAG: hypothetical protein LBW77_07690 [Verrucomicrobiota bacterium]|jgi:hypothetical protein|nr:hypothetical protein [Verrucomicrobiota bacterium]